MSIPFITRSRTGQPYRCSHPAAGWFAAALAAVTLISFGTEAQARQVYCYASEMDKSADKVSRTLDTPQKFYVTPIFASDDDVYLLMARLGEQVPDAGLATCVSDEDDPDIAASRQQFVDGIKAEGGTVVDQPMPVAPSASPAHRPAAVKCTKKKGCGP